MARLWRAKPICFWGTQPKRISCISSVLLGRTGSSWNPSGLKKGESKLDCPLSKFQKKTRTKEGCQILLAQSHIRRIHQARRKKQEPPTRRRTPRKKGRKGTVWAHHLLSARTSNQWGYRTQWMQKLVWRVPTPFVFLFLSLTYFVSICQPSQPNIS